MNEIVSFCPVCNAPIYGQKLMQQSYGQLSSPACDCREVLQKKVIAETDLLRAKAEKVRASSPIEQV
jgi:hypothetical protein